MVRVYIARVTDLGTKYAIDARTDYGKGFTFDINKPVTLQVITTKISEIVTLLNPPKPVVIPDYVDV